jgi:Ca2+-binding RTX toxin-like protein
VDALAGNDVVFGGPGNDVPLIWGFGNDDVYGEDGNDNIFGGPGDDRIDGDPETTSSAITTVPLLASLGTLRTRISSLTVPAMTLSAFKTATATTRCAPPMARP